MNQPDRSTPTLNRKDYLMILVAFGIAFACTYSLGGPFASGSYLFNQIFIFAVGLPVGILLFSAAMLMGPGLVINDAVTMEDSEFKKVLKEARSRLGKVRLVVSYDVKPTTGTVWHLTNADRAAWTNAVFLIERSINGEKVTDKHLLGVVEPGMRLLIESSLQDSEQAHWRVLVACSEGRSLELPKKALNQNDFDKLITVHTKKEKRIENQTSET